jgi:hypothetical protein
MSGKERIFDKLPEVFMRRDFMQIVSDTGYSYSYANYLLSEALNTGTLERVERGLYVKPEGNE